MNISVRIINMPNQERLYAVQIEYVQGGVIFTHNNDGKGLDLHNAQTLAFKMRDCTKRETELDGAD